MSLLKVGSHLVIKAPKLYYGNHAYGHGAIAIFFKLLIFRYMLEID